MSVSVMRTIPTSSMPVKRRSASTSPLARAARQIDLRHVAADDHLRTGAQAREEHLELLARRVLRFVEDHVRIGQRAAAHVGQRRDLDHAALEVLADRRVVERFAQRIVERAQIRIDFLFEIAGQKAELLAGFDGRPREHDARDLALLERAHRHHDREKRLARPGRTDAERQRVLGDARDERALAGRFGPDLFAALGDEQRRRECLRPPACGPKTRRRRASRACPRAPLAASRRARCPRAAPPRDRR